MIQLNYKHIKDKFLTSQNVRTASVKKNILASILIKGISIFVSLLIVPITLGYVNSTLYGIWLTISSVMLWLNFFDVGLTLGLKNRLGEALAKSNFSLGKSLISTTYVIMIFVFVPLCIILEFFVPFIPWNKLLNVSEIYNNEIGYAFYVMIFCFSIQMIAGVLTSVVSAFQKVALSSLFPVLGNVLTLLLILLFAKFSTPSLLKLSLAVSVTTPIVLIIASIYFYKTTFRSVSPSVEYVNFKYVRDLFNLGLKFFVIQIQVVVFLQTTNILISNVSSPNDVTYYNVAYKYMSVGMMLYNILMTPLWPAFTDAYTKKDYHWMKNIYRKFQKVFFCSFIFLVVLLIISPFAYKLWLNSQLEVPYSMTFIVFLYVALASWCSLQIFPLNGIGKIRLQTYVCLIGLFFHIPLALLLGEYLGAVGVVASLVIIHLIYAIIYTIQIRKILNNKALGIWNE